MLSICINSRDSPRGNFKRQAGIRAERTRPRTVKPLEPQEPRQQRITIGSVYYREKAGLLQMDQYEFGETSPKSGSGKCGRRFATCSIRTQRFSRILFALATS